jgi:iron(III) transport system substrate-binding protein
LAILVIALVTLAGVVYLASRTHQTTRTHRVPIVLYSSLDREVVEPIIARFREQTGIEVLLVGDTEATKTTGLVERLIAERERPRADVWWSSEVLGTIKLSRAGVLSAYTSAEVEKEFVGGWPKGLRSSRGDWYGLMLRPRVTVWRSGTSEPSAEHWSGADFAIADPHFGTTRGALAELSVRDAARFEGVLARAKDYRVVPGNAAVVRAVAQGEASAGETDYDDYLAALRNGWKLEMRPVGLCTPGSVALVEGGPNPVLAKALVDFILSAEVERELGKGEAGAIPVREAVRREFDWTAKFEVGSVDWENVFDASQGAIERWDGARK